METYTQSFNKEAWKLIHRASIKWPGNLYRTSISGMETYTQSFNKEAWKLIWSFNKVAWKLIQNFYKWHGNLYTELQ